MTGRLGIMLRDHVFQRDHDGVDRKMRTLRFGLEGAFAVLITVAAVSQLIGLPSHGVMDFVAAIVGFAAVVAVRHFHWFGA